MTTEPTMPTDDRPAAIIFRKRLLPWSETFIAAQGGSLRRYRPVFVGFRELPAGAAYLDGQDRVVLEDHAFSRNISKALLKGFGWVTPRWRRALEARRPAVMHVHFGVNAPNAMPIARTLGIPIVVTYHGMDIAIERRGRRVRRERQRIFRRAQRIIAVSGFIAELLREAGCPETKLVVHHIGIDTDRFAPGPAAERADARILFVGRLVPKKGFIHLLRAMPRVLRAVPDAEIVVAGDGPLRTDLEGTARRLRVPCRFLGVQTPDRVRRLMRESTLLCAPSIVAGDGNAEGLPMTVVEAQASGLPVVAFPSGGLSEGVVDGETGLIAPPRDEAALAQRLVTLLEDRDRRARFSEAARAHAVRNFDLKRQTTKLEAIYDAARAGAGSF
ncbi:MAG: glycosyltransferase [Gemmatimonadota bacterium]